MATRRAKELAAALETWVALNEVATGLTEEEARGLLERELAGKRRKQFVLRIHSRLNRVRADREREELLERIG